MLLCRMDTTVSKLVITQTINLSKRLSGSHNNLLFYVHTSNHVYKLGCVKHLHKYSTVDGAQRENVSASCTSDGA